MKQSQEIYVRATPREISVIENYRYKRLISVNSSYEALGEPTGNIEIIVPYDGADYFSHKALQDFKHQVADGLAFSEASASIGYLALSEYENTTLNELSNHIKQYDSLKVSIPVNKKLVEGNQIISDEYICKIEQDYKVLKQPDFELVKLNIDVLDDANSLDTDSPNPSDIKDHAGKANKIIQKVKYSTPEFPQLSGKLLVAFNIELSLPLDRSISGIRPYVKKLSVKWPTVTSLNEGNMVLYLNFKDGSSTGLGQENIRYNPANSSIEAFFDIPMNIVNRKPTSDVCTYTSPTLILAVGQPGELYQEDALEGEIEVELEGQLLSGLQTRYYGFDGVKVGTYLDGNHFQEISKINTQFELILDEAFQKRVHYIRQELNFGNIIPDDNCIRTITNELMQQEFDVREFDKISIRSNKSDREESRWLIYAKCSVGIDVLVLWLVIHGVKVSTKRESRQGDTQYTSLDESGDLILYMYANFPGSNHIPVQKINSLQAELRKQFSKQQRAR